MPELKVLFLGSAIRTVDCTRHRGPSVAGNKMQLGFLEALFELYGQNLHILTEYPVAAYPRERILGMGFDTLKLTSHMESKIVPFINVFLLKQLTLIVFAFFMVLAWGWKFKREPKIALCYNAYPYVALPLLWASRVFGFKVICILADPPLEVMSRSLVGRVAQRLEAATTVSSIKKFSAVVVLNDRAAIEYAPGLRSVRIEGGLDPNDFPLSDSNILGHSTNKALRVIFSGAVIEYNGIRALLSAAKNVKNPRFRLDLYGDGPLVPDVKKACSEDLRICYMGVKPNSEVITAQQAATLLVNPRLVDHPVSRVTFPSKILEYMASGTPIITTKLNGLTEEYLSHMYVFEDDSVSAITAGLEFVLSLPPDVLAAKATAAREYVLREKTWNVQVDKLVKLISEVQD